MGFREDLERLGINCNFSEIILSVPLYKYQAAPVAMTTVAEMTEAAFRSGIIVGNPTAGNTAYSFPAGADMDANAPHELVIGSSFDLTIINEAGGGNTITLTGSTGVTIVGVALIPVTSSATYRVRKTAADTFIAYSLNL